MTCKSVPWVGNHCLIPVCSLCYYYLVTWNFFYCFSAWKSIWNKSFIWDPELWWMWCLCETVAPKFRCAFDEVYLLKGPVLSVCICLGVLKAAGCKAPKPHLMRLLKGFIVFVYSDTQEKYWEDVLKGVKTTKKFTGNFRKSENLCKGLEQHSINTKHFSKH